MRLPHLSYSNLALNHTDCASLVGLPLVSAEHHVLTPNFALALNS